MATEVYLRRTVAALVRSLASLNVQPERAASPAMQAAYHAGYLRALSAVAEALLRVHGNTVRAWIRDGRLTAMQVRRGWRINKDDVMRLLGIEEE